MKLQQINLGVKCFHSDNPQIVIFLDHDFNLLYNFVGPNQPVEIRFWTNYVLFYDIVFL